MARTIQADGRTIVVPDDATPDEINQIVGPPPGPAGAGPLGTPQPKAPALPRGLSDEGAVRETIDEVSTPVHNDPLSKMGAGLIRNTAGAVAHPRRTLQSMVDSVTPDDTGPVGFAEQVGGPGVTAGIHLAKAAYNDPWGTLGGIAGGELTGKVAGPIADAGADALNATGRGLKTAGALSSRVGIGAPSADAAMGADAGRALSQNHIVGATPSSLMSKVNATIPEAAQARDNILARSPVGPNVDVTQPVNDSFNEITSRKTNPRTGAVRPAQQQKMVTTQRAINEVQDPQTGTPSGAPKPLGQLTPLEVGQLNRNIYDLADYQGSDSDLSNQAVKGAGAGLKAKIDEVAPEARTQTQTLHDLMGAKDTLTPKIGNGAIPTDKTGLVMSAVKGAKTYGGTKVGSLLDRAGTGAMKAGGAIRQARSPVAPSPPPSTTGVPPPPVPLTPQTGLQPPVPVTMPPSRGALPPPQPQYGARAATSVTTPPPVNPRGLLGQVAGASGAGPTPEGTPVGNLHPGAPNPATAATRIRPNPATLSQQVLSDHPGFVAPTGGRRLIVTPEGIRPEPIPLSSPMTEITKAADRAGEVRQARAPKTIEGAPTPQVAAPIPSRLPPSDDVDGWERLVDEGKARYNVQTHSYDYIAAPVRKSLSSRTTK